MAALTCPRDRTELVKQNWAGAVVHGCRRCGGLWLDRAGLAAGLTAAKPAAARRGLAVAVSTNPPAPCPVDGNEEMLQHVYGGIQVDVCRRHEGIWLDRGELERLTALWRPVEVRADGTFDPKLIAKVVVPGTTAAPPGKTSSCVVEGAVEGAVEVASQFIIPEAAVSLLRAVLGLLEP